MTIDFDGGTLRTNSSLSYYSNRSSGDETHSYSIQSYLKDEPEVKGNLLQERRITYEEYSRFFFNYIYNKMDMLKNFSEL